VEDIGNGNWVHLAGTYDGANWNLYRNGLLVASNPDATGAVFVNNANWAIGARGRWKNTTGLERLFNGMIDEVAIYNFALSSNNIAKHYTTGLAGLNPITITKAGSTITVSWSAGTLQSADNVAGPYSDVIGAVSPYTPPTSTQQFYRLRF
jgi:hypothetical protein